MDLNFNKIIRLKEIRAEKSKLSEEETSLMSPMLTNRGLIGEIYRIFVDLLNEQESHTNARSAAQRKKFVFIILCLFSPSTLAGGKMPCGLREELAKVLGVKCGCSISRNCSEIIVLYQNFKDFSGDIRYLYTQIVRRLGLEN